jgi:alpha-beta hydrolase superfamily lysophospholipase
MMTQMSAKVERSMKRWQEQRWILDAVVKTVGVEWDQGRIGYIMRPCGPEATFDFMGVKARIQKFTDIAREFGRTARRREAIARKFDEEGRTVSARESYFIASLLYGSAQWPIFENTPENIAYNEKKTECYMKYARYAAHEIRRAEIPFAGKSLPGYLHLPNKRPSGKMPCILTIGGMDTFKEMMHSMYGDDFLERGLASLAIDGPGQGECCVRDIHITGTNFMDAGRAALTWIREQPEIDPDRIAIFGVSFGSLWATQVAAIDQRVKGCAVAFVCHEPGAKTVFNATSPSFKLRFMYMAGYDDEEKFDRFSDTINLDGIGEKITAPYLVIAGEDDELSPIEYTYELLETIKAPKELLLYQGERHALHTNSATALGPSWLGYMLEWLKDRLGGKPMESQYTLVDLLGQTQPLETPKRSVQ